MCVCYTKAFVTRVLGRIGHLLETAQPEELHGLLAHRLDQHGSSRWYCYLDHPFGFVQSFRSLIWQSLWKALRCHGVSDHLVWLSQCAYHEQYGKVKDDLGHGRVFKIGAGVTQSAASVHVCFVLYWNGQCAHGEVWLRRLVFDLGDVLPRNQPPRTQWHQQIFRRAVTEISIA